MKKKEQYRFAPNDPKKREKITKERAFPERRDRFGKDSNQGAQEDFACRTGEDGRRIVTT